MFVAKCLFCRQMLKGANAQFARMCMLEQRLQYTASVEAVKRYIAV